MIDTRLIHLLWTLSEDHFKTASELAVENKVSEKTIRMRIKSLQSILNECGAEITARPRKGYQLDIHDRGKYEKWKRKVLGEADKALPNSPEERFQYLLTLFLTRKEYFKLESVSEFLCVSNKTVSMEMKRIEYVLQQYNIEIIRKPYHGIKAIGDEFSFRICMMDYLVKPEYHALNDELKQEEMSEKIGSVLLQIMLENELKFSEISFQNLVLYLFVMCRRIKHGYHVSVEKSMIEKTQSSNEYQIAEEILQKLVEAGVCVNYSDAECFYVSVYIAGRQVSGESTAIDSNYVVSEKIFQLVDTVLNTIYKVYHIDFSDNLNLKMLLINHMASFHIRMSYGIPLKNPLLEEIRIKYPFVYAMAQCGLSSIASMYRREISEDEVSYFTVLFEMGIEETQGEERRKNLLIVCETGKSSSQFLMFRFRKEFDKYIDHLYNCSVYEFEKYDLSNIDYIFSTVPIRRKVNVPIFQIGTFLEAEEILRVRKKLEVEDPDFLREYYRKELFFTDVEGDSKEEVICELCKKIEKVYPLPKGFQESVLEREACGSTDYGNLVALPHPNKILMEENLVCVGILKKPILWERNKVQFVLLVSVSDSTNRDTQKFYEKTTGVITNSEKIKEIIESKSMDVLRYFLNE